MAKDPETDVDPKAKDGEPESLEEARRRLRDEKDEAAVSAKKGNAIDGQEPGVGDDGDGQLFISEPGRKVSLGTAIPKGVPVEHAFVFSQARRKGTGGLIPPEEDVLLVVRGKVGSIKPTYKRNDEEQIESVTVEQLITTKVVVPASSDEALNLLRGVLEARGIRAA